MLIQKRSPAKPNVMDEKTNENSITEAFQNMKIHKLVINYSRSPCFFPERLNFKTVKEVI